MRTTRTARAVATIVLAVAALIVSCAPDRPGATPAPAVLPNATPDEISAAATLSALSTGSRAGGSAIDFTLKSIDGVDVSLSDLSGKGVVIAFWATWCEYCREELPLIAELYEEVRDDGIEVLAVNVMDEPERVLAYVSEFQLPYPVLMDRRGEVAEQYRVRGLPTTVFIDAEGAVQRVHPGTIDEETLRFFAETLLPQEG